MSRGPDGPGAPHEGRDPGESRRIAGGGHLAAALVGGALGLFAIYLVIGRSTSLGYPSFTPPGAVTLLPVGVYLALAVLLVRSPRTRRTGTGLLFGLGIWLVLGGGPCLASLTGVFT